MKLNQNLVLVIAAVLSLAVGFTVFKSLSSEEFAETTFVYQPERILKPFELVDHKNRPFDNQALNGKWSLAFLGYLSCPDVCPMTMAKLSRALPELKSLTQNNVQVLFVSVDPKRDTSENIDQYVNYFSSDIVGLRAEHKALFPFVRNLGLMYSIPNQETLDEYYVDHSGSIILINPEGKIAAIFKPEIVLNQVPTVNMTLLLQDLAKLI